MLVDALTGPVGNKDGGVVPDDEDFVTGEATADHVGHSRGPYGPVGADAHDVRAGGQVAWSLRRRAIRRLGLGALRSGAGWLCFRRG